MVPSPVLWTLSLLLAGQMLLGQGVDPPGRQRFRTYGVAEGLENLSVKAVVQDAPGFIWVGTEGNLYRYDGTRFRVFGMEDGLPSGNITTLLAQGNGSVWIGTYKGLAHWNGSRMRAVEALQGLPSERVNDVHASLEGAVWVALSSGLYGSRDGERFELAAGWPGGEASAVWPAAGGEIWVSSGSLLRRRDARGTWTAMGSESGLGRERIDALAQDAAGRLWVRSARFLWMRAPGQARFQDLSSHVHGINKDEGSLYLDREQRLWVPTEHGLASFDAGGWSFLGEDQGLPTSGPKGICLDHEGTLWVGGQGVHRALGQGVWKSYSRPEGLPHDTVWMIHRDASGHLLVGTDAGLVKGGAKGWDRIPGTESYAIRTLARSSEGVYWLAGSGPVLLRWEEGARRLSRWGPESGMKGRRVLRLLVDQEGTLWVATDGAGLLRGVRSGEGWRFQSEALPEGRPTERISHILEDRWHRLWACGEQGLACREGGVWRRYTTRDGLRFTYASYLVQLKDGSFRGSYFDPQGTFRLDALPGSFHVTGYLNRANGLASDKVYLLGEDARGRLWIGTGRGVDMVEDQQIFHHGGGEGMPGEDCDSMAFMADSDGGVWIGTSTGLAHHTNPPETRAALPPATAIVEAALGDAAVDPAGEATVARSRNTLIARYSALSYLNETRVEYQVSLAGLESGWVDTRQREVRYPLLPHGRYEFKVRARHPGGAWGPTASFSFLVRPAWWERAWAKGLGLLLLAGLGYALVRWRLRTLQHRNVELESLVAHRTEQLTQANAELLSAKEDVERASQYKSAFLASMSHELRTPLNAILLYGELLQEEARDAGNAGAVEDLDRIRHSGAHLLSLINGILDLSKIEAGKMSLYLETIELAPIVEDVVDTLRPMVEKGGNRLEVRLDPNLRTLKVDVTKLRQILYNLVSNASKFTKQGAITLETEKRDAEMCFRVKDTGIGMTPDQVSRLFQEFVQAEESTSRRYGGTGLGLTITKKLCELMEGRIAVESEVGKGTTFTVFLPLSPGTTSESSRPTAESQAG
jgi:signal transduction histidine kinase/ligand-binding sensor domain-containing protein